MARWPGRAELTAIGERGRAAAHKLALVVGQQRGSAGGVLGRGAGSSIEYQDHRPYAPGDDPRHIDWYAYARSGQYVLKTYREEVSPELDLVIDLSGSMALDDTKRTRSLELIYFLRESAVRASLSLRCFQAGVDGVGRLENDAIDAADFLREPASELREGALELARVPFRPRARRIVISDLLFAAEPRSLLLPFAGGPGRSAILCPYAASEAEPDWLGPLELVDVESRAARAEVCDRALLDRYAAAYQRHFQTWRDECRRLGVALLRVAAQVELVEALSAEGLAAGVVAPWS